MDSATLFSAFVSGMKTPVGIAANASIPVGIAPVGFWCGLFIAAFYCGVFSKSLHFYFSPSDAIRLHRLTHM